MNQKVRKARVILASAILVIALAGFASCEKFTFTPPAVDPNYAWSLSADIQPIFNANCITCHGGTQAPDLRTGKSYNALTKGGYVNLPGETSKLYVQITTNSGHVPKTTDTEKQKILYWINQGAKNN
jgi:hypothetical protein